MVPVVAQRSVYSGSPLLRQILISKRQYYNMLSLTPPPPSDGRKRQFDEMCPEGSSPSPIVVSRKRFCLEEGQVPNSLVVLKRTQPTTKKHGDCFNILTSIIMILLYCPHR